MIVVPFKKEHLFLLEPQEAQREEIDNITIEQAIWLEDTPAFTAMEGGVPMLCGGALPFHGNRALIWSYVSAKAGRKFVKLTRLVQQYLSTLPYRRLEIDVDLEFEQGHRWAELLGFKMETAVMRSYFANGHDATKYVRIG